MSSTFKRLLNIQINIFQSILESSLPKIIFEPCHLHAQIVQLSFADWLMTRGEGSERPLSSLLLRVLRHHNHGSGFPLREALLLEVGTPLSLWKRFSCSGEADSCCVWAVYLQIKMARELRLRWNHKPSFSCQGLERVGDLKPGHQRKESRVTFSLSDTQFPHMENR